MEQHIPEVPDGQVQLADGFLSLPARGMVAHQSQRRFEQQSCGDSRRSTMSFMPTAMRSRSDARSGVALLRRLPQRETAHRRYTRLVHLPGHPAAARHDDLVRSGGCWT